MNCHSPSARTELMAAKLQPRRIRDTLQFATLIQLTHELIKRSVLKGVKGFYGHVEYNGVDEWIGGDREIYERDVLARVPGRQFDASIAWLVDHDALSHHQADRLSEIYSHRHDLTHEIAKYVIDPEFEPNRKLYVEAVQILQTLERFWMEIEVDSGLLYEHPTATIDDVTPGRLLILQLCLDAYLDGITREG